MAQVGAFKESLYRPDPVQPVLKQAGLDPQERRAVQVCFEDS